MGENQSIPELNTRESRPPIVGKRSTELRRRRKDNARCRRGVTKKHIKQCWLTNSLPESARWVTAYPCVDNGYSATYIQWQADPSREGERESEVRIGGEYSSLGVDPVKPNESSPMVRFEGSRNRY